MMDIGEVRRLREEYETALDEVEARRASYHRAVRMLHMSGVPLRQIAEQLGVSHQRVHQMVGEAPPIRNRRRRVAGTAGAVLILLVGTLLWTGLRTSIAPRGIFGPSPPAPPTLLVEVLTFDRSWRFYYQAHGVAVQGFPKDPPTILLPSSRSIRFTLATKDVSHSFWIPRLAGKQDIVPGKTSSFELRGLQPGLYRGVDAEFAGLDHALPGFTVKVVTPDRFARWVHSRPTQAL